MAQVTYNGQSYAVPDTLSPEVAMKMIMAQQAQETSVKVAQEQAAGAKAPAQVQDNVNPDDLQNNKDWVAASKQLYYASHKVQFAGTEKEAADYGLDKMGWFNYNLPTMAVDAVRLKSMKDEDKQAFLYMMDTYDKLGYSWGGAWRFVKGAALDPTTYVGLSTLGFGSAASTATKIASKEALKAMLQTGVMTAVEGGIQSAASDYITQTARVNAGGKDAVDSGEVLKSAAIGAAAGGVLGAGVEAVKTVLPGAVKKVLGRKEPQPWEASNEAIASGKVKVGTITPDPSAASSVEAKALPEVGPLKELPKATVTEPPRMGDIENGYGIHGFESGKVRFAGTNKEFEAKLNDKGHLVDAATDTVVDPRALSHFQDKNGKWVDVAKGEPKAPTSEPKTPTGESKAPTSGPKADTQVNTQSLSHITDPTERIVQAIRDASAKYSMDFFPKNASKDAKTATELLAEVTPTDIGKVVDNLKAVAGNGPERQMLTTAAKDSWEQLQAHSEVLYADLVANPTAEKQIALGQVENIRDKIKIMDEAFSSLQGTELANRVGGMNVEGKLRGVTEDTLLMSKGVNPAEAPPEALKWAKEEYYRISNEMREGAKKSNEVLALTEQIDKLKLEGNIGEAIKLSADRSKLLDEVAAKKGQSLGFGRKVLNDLNTYIISTVFSTSTLAINTVPSLAKTIYKPLLEFLATGIGDKAAAKQMITQYHTMATSMDVAFRAAKAAFQYEHGLYNATKFGSKFDEMSVGTGVFDNQFGRALRIFPRLLGATDEFFGQLHYRGFVMGNEAANAVEKASAKGLTGDALDKFVSEHLAKTHEGLFTKDTVHSADVLDFLRDAASNKGLKGDKATEWIKLQLDKNDDLFKLASSKAGTDYADDVLFKRKFSGENKASMLAKDYEEFVQKNPWMRPMGQLFFRTPVRVFEEGFRVTPGLNLITPQFIADLQGKNGQARYARAMGEAMVSYGVGMWVMMQYAAGNITGGGPEDYKQRRLRESAGDWEPYTIKFGTHTLNFRNIDPFSTPMKIMVNALERYNHLLMRQSLGEMTNETDMQMAIHYFAVGMGSVVQAIKDANLTDGMEQLSKLQENIMDPEDKDSAFAKFFGQKATLAVPNMAKKVIQQGDTVMPDPVSIDQFIRAAVNPSSQHVSHQHDILGNKRNYGDPVGGLTGFKVGDPKAKQDKMTDEQRYVLKSVSDIGIATGKSFAMPVKDQKFFPRTDDLRTVMTEDKTATLYDRLNEKLRGTNLTHALYKSLKQTERASPADRAKAVNEVLQLHRQQAVMQMWREEAGLKGDMANSMKEEAAINKGNRGGVPLSYR